MSFTGDLEHLPIVDVIQLLHATKKTGTLTVKSRKGESQLAFDGGYIVSANHSNDSVRIGKVLVEIKAITTEVLDRALLEQKKAGESRKPLIAMLIEKGLVRKEQAFKGLETLIELTIVEILTWTSGTFFLEVDKIAVSDEYRYLPDKLQQAMHLNTQNVLMDALRIYDEKKRDGELDAMTSEEQLRESEGLNEEGLTMLSADDLGLADLDRLERKIPGVFSSLEILDPVETHRRKIAALAPALSSKEKEALASSLAGFSATEPAGSETAQQKGGSLAVILFSEDQLLNHAVSTVCKQEGIPVFATNEEQNLDPIIDQSLSKKMIPVLVLDSPGGSEAGFGEKQIVDLRRLKRNVYPQLPILQLASATEYTFSLQALADGIRAVLPRPSVEQKEGFAEDAILFLKAFGSYVNGIEGRAEDRSSRGLSRRLSDLRTLKEAPEAAFALLQFVSEMFERSLTLIVGPSELIAEKGFGVKAEKSAGATAGMGFRIPLAKASIFRKVVEEGRPFFGKIEDEVLREHLFAAIGAPRSSTVLLLPLQSRGRTISLAYGDFGDREDAPVQLDSLEIVAGQAGLILENAFYRKKVEGNPQ